MEEVWARGKLKENQMNEDLQEQDTERRQKMKVDKFNKELNGEGSKEWK